jgi:hypothetical protein
VLGLEIYSRSRSCYDIEKEATALEEEDIYAPLNADK